MFVIFKVDELQQNFWFSEPVNYKLSNGMSLDLYPILVKDSYFFENNYGILDLQKNDIASVEVIQMSYLEFLLLYLANRDDGKKRMADFIKLLSLCLHIDEEKIFPVFDDKDIKKPRLIICDSDDNILNYITQKDFEDIRKIILFQNVYDYDDTYISPDIRKLIEDRNKLMGNDNYKKITIEDKMIFLGNNIGFNNKDLMNMTYREFNRRFYSAVEIMDYKINKTAEMSGNVKFNKGIEHPIYKKNVSKYEQLFVDKDSLKNKIQNA